MKRKKDKENGRLGNEWWVLKIGRNVNINSQFSSIRVDASLPLIWASNTNMYDSTTSATNLCMTSQYTFVFVEACPGLSCGSGIIIVAGLVSVLQL